MSVEDLEMLNRLAEADHLPNASMVRYLIRMEHKRRYEDQQPMIRPVKPKKKR